MDDADYKLLELYIENESISQALYVVRFRERYPKMYSLTTQQIVDIRKNLVTAKYIEQVYNNEWCDIITESGGECYKEEKQNRAKEKAIKEAGDEKLLQETKNAKRWLIPITIAGISALIALFTFLWNLVSNRDYEKKLQQLEKQQLILQEKELKIQQTNTRTLYVVDSLWKTEHKSATPGKK